MSAEPMLRLHHVGYVVAEIAKGMEAFRTSLGGTWDGRIFDDPNQRVKVAFLYTRPGDPSIELVEADGPGSPVAAFLARRGGGLHHVCYEVDNLEEALATMKARKALIASRPKPAVAFDGRRIAWVITAEKLLVEFLETH